MRISVMAITRTLLLFVFIQTVRSLSSLNPDESGSMLPFLDANSAMAMRGVSRSYERSIRAKTEQEFEKLRDLIVGLSGSHNHSDDGFDLHQIQTLVHQNSLLKLKLKAELPLVFSLFSYQTRVLHRAIVTNKLSLNRNVSHSSDIGTHFYQQLTSITDAYSFKAFGSLFALKLIDRYLNGRDPEQCILKDIRSGGRAGIAGLITNDISATYVVAFDEGAFQILCNYELYPSIPTTQFGEALYRVVNAYLSANPVSQWFEPRPGRTRTSRVRTLSEFRRRKCDRHRWSQAILPYVAEATQHLSDSKHVNSLRKILDLVSEIRTKIGFDVTGDALDSCSSALFAKLMDLDPTMGAGKRQMAIKG